MSSHLLHGGTDKMLHLAHKVEFGTTLMGACILKIGGCLGSFGTRAEIFEGGHAASSCSRSAIRKGGIQPFCAGRTKSH